MPSCKHSPAEESEATGKDCFVGVSKIVDGEQSIQKLDSLRGELFSAIVVSATAVSDVLMHLHYDDSELTYVVDEIEIL
jgi:hypothetical protein